MSARSYEVKLDGDSRFFESEKALLGIVEAASWGNQDCIAWLQERMAVGENLLAVAGRIPK